MVVKRASIVRTNIISANPLTIVGGVWPKFCFVRAVLPLPFNLPPGLRPRMATRRRKRRKGGSYATYRMPWQPRPTWCWCVVSRETWVLTWYSRSGYVIRCLSGSFSARDAAAQVLQLQDEETQPVQRRRKPGVDAPKPPHAEYADLLERYPTLAGWMTDATFEDGEVRQGGWICVSCRGGLWCCTMKDSAEAVCIHISAPTATLLLDLCEHSLIDPAAPWRPDTGPSGAKAKAKK